jgi:anti-anti-sigma factor
MDSGTTVNPSLDISTRTMGGITIAELAGELDIASVPVLREQLLGLLRHGSSRLFIDLSKVSPCDARGLAVLVGIGRRARLLGGFLRLAAVSPHADEVLRITGLHRHLPISPLSTQPQPVSPPPAIAGPAEIATPSSGSRMPGAGPPSAEIERAVTGGARTYSGPAAAMSPARSPRMWVIAPVA